MSGGAPLRSGPARAACRSGRPHRLDFLYHNNNGEVVITHPCGRFAMRLAPEELSVVPLIDRETPSDTNAKVCQSNRNLWRGPGRDEKTRCPEDAYTCIYTCGIYNNITDGINSHRLPLMDRRRVSRFQKGDLGRVSGGDLLRQRPRRDQRPRVIRARG